MERLEELKREGLLPEEYAGCGQPARAAMALLENYCEKQFSFWELWMYDLSIHFQENPERQLELAIAFLEAERKRRKEAGE